jgi:hypothetical protein
MPTIPLELLDCTIYVYRDGDAAEKGEEAGGSGFLVAVPLTGYRAATFYAVTNSHVVAGGFTTIRLNEMAGGHATIELTADDWIRHPEGDDVVIADVNLSADFRFKAVSTEQFVDGFDPTYFNVGQEVVMVGRYVNHEGRQRNLPTARFGHVAQLPHERVRTSWGIEQDAFLVDMRSLAGYSGSPVFVYRGRPDLDEDPERWVKSVEFRFLGVDFGHLPSFVRVLDASRRNAVDPPMWAEQNSGVAAVIPAWRLMQLIDEEGVAAKRAQDEDSWITQHGNDPDMKL